MHEERAPRRTEESSRGGLKLDKALPDYPQTRFESYKRAQTSPSPGFPQLHTVELGDFFERCQGVSVSR